MKKVKLILLGLLVAFFLQTPAAITKSSEPSNNAELVIFHAGSLAVPFKQVCKEFNKLHPETKIVREAAGSRVCARKISELNRPCDVMASADYTVIDELLIDEHAKWNIKFASNEMVIAFRDNSNKAKQINKDNWHDILLDKEIAYGRSDPNSDPCGYRTALIIKLAEKYYKKPALAKDLLKKDKRYIRPKEVDLLALLEVGEIDYFFIYRSVAEQHKLKYLTLPDEINLKKTKFADYYKNASIRLTGKKPGTFITKTASPVVYGVTIPNNAPNNVLAKKFLTFLLTSEKGGAILKENGQTLLVPAPTKTFDKIPAELKKFAKPVPKHEKNVKTTAKI